MIESLEKIQVIALNEIKTSPLNTRKDFNEDKIKKLASSIRKEGLLNPILVRRLKHHYEIICGERRFKACQLIEKLTIDAIVKQTNDSGVLLIQFTENMQREDLNYMEEAVNLQKIMAKTNCLAPELSKHIHKSETWVRNRLSFLNLRSDFKKMLIGGKITPGHVKAINQLAGKNVFLDVVKTVLDERSVSVTELWQIVHTLLDDAEKKDETSKKYQLKRIKQKANMTFKQIITLIKQKTNNRLIWDHLNTLSAMYDDEKSKTKEG